MRVTSFLFSLLFSPIVFAAPHAHVVARDASQTKQISPKVFIFSLFLDEGEVWYRRWPKTELGALDAVKVEIPGLAPEFQQVQCTPSGDVCQITTGMGEINSAATAMAVLLSPTFDFTKTYFILSGIAGVNPERATLGSVAIGKFAVQVALQYEIDGRDIPSNWSTGYVAYGTKEPLQYPVTLYGSEVFELNENLRDLALKVASKANLSDSEDTEAYRSKYADVKEQSSAVQKPSVLACDVTTSDVYFTGKHLAEAFDNVTSVWTDGKGQYCMTASEDNAILEVIVRLARAKLVDFARVMVMRSGSNFDRPPPGISAADHLLKENQNGFPIAIDNLYNAGMPIVQEILTQWDCQFAEGIAADNYIGDIWGSLGGEPDFGPGRLKTLDQ